MSTPLGAEDRYHLNKSIEDLEDLRELATKLGFTDDVEYYTRIINQKRSQEDG